MPEAIRRHPARSFLFAPANHDRRAEKAFQLGADGVILDLEDAVALADKVTARQEAVTAFKAAAPGSRRYLRINGTATEWCQGDLNECIGPWLDGIVVPKVECAEGLMQLEAWLSEAESRTGLEQGSLDMVGIIETARGVEQVNEIATVSSRLSRLALGGGDYTLDLDYTWDSEEEVFNYPRSRLAHASRLGNLLPPVDTVVIQVKDDARFSASAARGRRFGFGGKLCIHPSQIPLTHEVFTPSAHEIERARAVVAAFEAAETQGNAAIQLDGQFIDYPVVAKSQRVLALAEALAALKH